MITRFSEDNISFSLGGLDFYLSSAAIEKFERNIPSHTHSNNSYEIHYIAHGKGYSTINNKEYCLNPNSLFVTGPGVEHSQFPDKEDPMWEYCLYFRVQKVSKSTNDIEAEIADLFLNNTFWFGEDSQKLLTLLQMIFTQFNEKPFGYEIMLETLLKQFIVKLVRNYRDNGDSRESSKKCCHMCNTYLIIEEAFLYEYNTLTLEQLSERLGLGTRQTERLLKEHYEKTFTQKKTEARMSAAQLFLSDPENSISAIAEKVGYSSIEHFSSAFKRHFGVSPSKYKNT